MVEDFEKKYGALAIPYPKDSAVADIAAEEAKQVAAYNKHVAESQARATTVSAELAKVKEIGYTFFGYISIKLLDVELLQSVNYHLSFTVGSYDANRRNELRRSYSCSPSPCSESQPR